MRSVLSRLMAPAALAVGLTVGLTLLTGCGGSSGSGRPGRPTTSAKLTILQPVPNQVTGSAVTLQLQLTGASIVPFTDAKVVPDQGHVHVSVDGVLVSMTQGLSQPLTGLTPGPHLVRAEFVASDHVPFANRVIADVEFTVK